MSRLARLPSLPVLLGTAAGLATTADLLARVESSGAVPAAEFGPAGPLYSAIPILEIFGILAAAAALVLGLRAKAPYRDRLLPILAAALLSLSPMMRILVLPGAVAALAAIAFLALARPRAEAAPRFRDAGPGPAKAHPGPGTPSAAEPSPVVDATDGPRALPLRGLVLGLVLATALGAVAALLLALAESVFYSARFPRELVTPSMLRGLWSALPALAVFLGIEIGISVAGLLVVSRLALRPLRRSTPLDGRERWRRVAIVAGLALGISVAVQAWTCLVSETAALGVTGHGFVLGTLAGCGLARTLARRVLDPALASARAAAGASVPGALGLVFHLALLPPLPVRMRSALLARPLAVAATGGGVAVLVLLGLSLLLYPEVEDFRMQLFDAYARIQVALLALALGAFVVGRGRRRRWPRSAVAVVVLAVALMPLGWRVLAADAETALTVAEYSRFASLAAESPLARVVVPLARIGLGAPPAEPSPFFTPVPDAAPRRAAIRDLPPIVFVMWDAGRPDRTSVYGHVRRTTPHLERLAADGAVFERAWSMATATTCGVRHLLSGRYSSRYMLATDHDPFLLRELATAGYATFVLTVTGTDFNGVSGASFRRGWDAARPGLSFEIIEFENDEHRKNDAEKTTDVIARWKRLCRDAGPKGLDGSFTFLHLISPHSPWSNADHPVADFGRRPEDLYDGELAKADRELGRILEALDALGAADRAIVVVTADHGTGLGEHGRYAGFLPYEEQLRVPLVIRAPGFAPRRIAAPVTSIDLAPTLVALATNEPLDRFHGRDLSPLLAGRRERLPPRPFVSLCAFRDSYAVFDEDARWKLIHHRGRGYEVLYDLQRDPGERVVRNAEAPEILARLRGLLDEFLASGKASFGHPHHYSPP